MARGVVVATGAVSVAKTCGATGQVASVRLSDGIVVYAFADAVGPLRPGTQVSLQKQWSRCAPVAYEVVALQ
jgi:ribosomal protein S12